MENLWRDDEARGLEGIDLLVYRSRLIGRDPALVLWGGGNTSVKRTETDFDGRATRVLRIKGSGSDLRTIEPRHFPGIRLEPVEALFRRASMSDDEMVAYLIHCLMEPGSPRPSIETLLHGFVPHAHIDHTHADAILALTNTVEGRRHVDAVFGAEAAWVPYRRPGFALSREVAEVVRASPKARAVVLEKHGLITWGETARQSYDATIEMNSRAEEYARDKGRGKVVFGAPARPALAPEARRKLASEIAPFVRGALSGRDQQDGGWPRVVLRLDDGDDVLDFVGSEAAPQLCLAGPATPDHLLYTKPRPLFVDGRPAAGGDAAGVEAVKRAFTEGLRRYTDWYELYFSKNSRGETRLDPIPRVILIAGVGMLTAWKDARHTRIVSDIYHHTIHVMRAAQAIGTYRSLSIKDTFEVEYWPMELYKLSLAPRERDLARRVALITGAAGGIGRAIARRFAAEDCHVVVTDRDASGAAAVAREICAAHGPDRAFGVRLDVTDETSVEEGFAQAVLAYGGLDVVVSNAGTAHVAPLDHLDLEDWRRSFDVNATGHFLVARAALRLLKNQGIGGGLVFNASKNVLAPGKDFGAYSAAKAAEVQLARVLAIEAGGEGIRVNIVSPDAVFQESGLWSEAVRAERARAHGISPDQIEEFYRRRNLLGVQVTAEHVAEAALWLASDRSAATTGCIVTIDGGVREAFPR